MKRVIFIAVLSPIALFLLFWAGSLLHCEYLTAKHGAEFDEARMEICRIFPVEELKVIDYSPLYAEVYFCSDGIGALVSYRKADGTWTELSQKAWWSDSGSADDIIWPYIR